MYFLYPKNYWASKKGRLDWARRILSILPEKGEASYLPSTYYILGMVADFLNVNTNLIFFTFYFFYSCLEASARASFFGLKINFQRISFWHYFWRMQWATILHIHFRSIVNIVKWQKVRFTICWSGDVKVEKL